MKKAIVCWSRTASVLTNACCSSKASATPYAPLVYSRFGQTRPMRAKTERNHTGVDSPAHTDDPHKVQLLLIRHGLVVEDVSGLSAQRSHLSSKGRKVVRDVGRVLHGLNLSLDAIVVSPMVATVQTAELLAERLDFLDVVEVLHSLGSGIPPQLAAKTFSQALA